MEKERENDAIQSSLMGLRKSEESFQPHDDGSISSQHHSDDSSETNCLVRWTGMAEWTSICVLDYSPANYTHVPQSTDEICVSKRTRIFSTHISHQQKKLLN